MINPQLFKMATDSLNRMRKKGITKHAFQPPEGDPSQGGAPGGDPSQGGMPPGGDPSQGGMPPGGAPPADPNAGAGGPNPLDQVMQQMQQLQMQVQQMQMGGGAGGMGGKVQKQDQQAAAAQDNYQIKMMLFAIANGMGIEIPPALLAGPNRDPNSGAVLPQGAPGSTSDPQVMMQQAQEAASNGQGGQQGGQQGGGQSAIPPMQPMQPAMPTDPGAGKTAGHIGTPFDRNTEGAGVPQTKIGRSVQDKASALAMLLRGQQKGS